MIILKKYYTHTYPINSNIKSTLPCVEPGNEPVTDEVSAPVPGINPLGKYIATIASYDN